MASELRLTPLVSGILSAEFDSQAWRRKIRGEDEQERAFDCDNDLGTRCPGGAATASILILSRGVQYSNLRDGWWVWQSVYRISSQLLTFQGSRGGRARRLATGQRKYPGGSGVGCHTHPLYGARQDGVLSGQLAYTHPRSSGG